MNNIDILHEYNDKLIEEYDLSIENINELNETICNTMKFIFDHLTELFGRISK